MHNHRRAINWTRVLLVISGFVIIVSISIFSLIFFFPFIMALLFSFFFLPIVNALENKWNWHRSLSTFLVISLFMVILLTLITFLVAELVHSLSYLTKVLPTYIQDSTNTIHQLIEKNLLPIMSDLSRFTSGLSIDSRSTIDLTIDQLLNEVGLQLGLLIQSILNALRDFFLAIPHAMTMILFSLIASFFITKDWLNITSWVNSRFPRSLNQLIGRMVNEWKGALGNYFMAQLTLVSITSVIVFIGLLILNVEYAFTLAILTAMVDLLPYVGTGIVFIPWIIFSFFNESWFMTIGLSTLYGIVVLQRQLSEPKIMAKHMGVPPLLLLFTIFACYQFFGIVGVLLGPFLLIFLQSMFRAGIIEEVNHYIRK